MKTSHEMTVSVLRKRDKILRRRRILTTSIGALAGTAAVAAALLITLNVTRPRGVDLIAAPDSSEPGDTSVTALLTDKEAPPLTAASFVDNEATGIPQSYEELQDFISPYSKVNFLEFEVIRRYPAEEAYETTKDDMFLHSTTLYDIHVTYDHINGQPLDIYTRLLSAGTAENQIEGYPPYSEGDKFACFLPNFDPDDINYELSELLFAVDDADDASVGYHVGSDRIDFIDPAGNNIADDNFTAVSVITSTSNNPVTYTDMIPMDALSDFLRKDWLSRGYSCWTSQDLDSGGAPAGSTEHSAEAVSGLLAESWLNKWEQISADMDMTLPQASVFGFELKDGSRLAAIVFPTYKTNSAALYRVTDSGFTEYGEFGCGWQFELLENSTEQFLHIMTKYPGSAANSDSLEIEDEYYRITETGLEPVFRAGRNVYGDKAYDWFVYENGDAAHISGEEYEQLKTDALKYSTVVSTADLDKDGDYQNDEYCAFEDDPDGLKAAILEAL